MKPLFMLFLIAATAAAAPITALFTCVSNTSQMVATGGLSANFGGDTFCESATSPSRVNLSIAPVGASGGIGYIGSFSLFPSSFGPGGIANLTAVFDLEPLGNAAVGYFSVTRVVTEFPRVTEVPFRLDVAGTYARLAPRFLGETRIAFDFNADIPEPGTWALYSIGLIGVLGWRRWGRSGAATP